MTDDLPDSHTPRPVWRSCSDACMCAPQHGNLGAAPPVTILLLHVPRYCCWCLSQGVVLATSSSLSAASVASSGGDGIVSSNSLAVTAERHDSTYLPYIGLPYIRITN